MVGSGHTYLLTQTVPLSLGPQVSTKGVVTPGGRTDCATLADAESRAREINEALMLDGSVDLDDGCKQEDGQGSKRVYVGCPCLRGGCGVLFPVLGRFV